MNKIRRGGKQYALPSRLSLYKIIQMPAFMRKAVFISISPQHIFVMYYTVKKVPLRLAC